MQNGEDDKYFSSDNDNKVNGGVFCHPIEIDKNVHCPW